MNIVNWVENKATELKCKVLETETQIDVYGSAYYVSADGNDENNGTIDEPWCSIDRVSNADLKAGDVVFFRRGDVFRGQIKVRDGVTYSAYGQGLKPKIYASPENGADEQKWNLLEGTNNIWVYYRDMLDVGILVFNDGKKWSLKEIADYKDNDFFISDTNEKFDVSNRLCKNYSHFCDCRSEIGNNSKPTPNAMGKLYLRCDEGNPGRVFNSIEFNIRLNIVDLQNSSNVYIDNLCLKYGGAHGIGGGHIKNLTVKNCEIGFIGGCIQLYKSNGKATRYGNGVEVYGSCDGYYVENNYVYQCYDAGITHQQGAPGSSYEFKNVAYRGNLVENCIYSIEYFMSAPEDKRFTRVMKNIIVEDNILRFAGCGIGAQRHNGNVGSHILGWWSSANRAEDFVVKNNIFDRSDETIIQICADKKQWLPKLLGNTYIQYKDALFGRYGAKQPGGLEYATTQNKYDLNITEFIENIIEDTQNKLYFIGE